MVEGVEGGRLAKKDGACRGIGRKVQKIERVENATGAKKLILPRKAVE
jgi:hypothetical protein